MDTEQCVHCGLCLTACPTYHTTGLEVQSPRGRLVLLQEWMEDPGAREAETFGWLDDCLDCRACETVCPAHVPTGHLVEAWRANITPLPTNRRLGQLMAGYLGSPGGLRRFQRLVRWGRSPLATVGLRLAPSSWRSALTGLRLGLPSPLPRQLSRDAMAEPVPQADVMLFVGCVMDALYPNSNQHTRALLQLAGLTVSVPTEQVCCGALHLHQGNPDVARRWARQNIAAWERSGAGLVVVNAAGCSTTLKEYPRLFGDDVQWLGRAQSFSAAVKDFLEMIDHHPLPMLPAGATTLSVHDACHHTAQGLTAPARTLLQRAGYRIVEMDDATRCCGSAGVYNLTHPLMSDLLAQDKVKSIPENIAVVAAANPGCMLQIQSAARRFGRPEVVVHHPVDLAHRAYQEAGLIGQAGHD